MPRAGGCMLDDHPFILYNPGWKRITGDQAFIRKDELAIGCML
jgi:hypothetical protein